MEGNVLEEWSHVVDLDATSIPLNLASDTTLTANVREQVYRYMIEKNVNPHTGGQGCFCCWDCGSRVKDLDGLTDEGQCSAATEAIVWGEEDMGVLERAGVDLRGCDPMGNTILDFVTADLRCVFDEGMDSIGERRKALKKVLDYKSDLTHFWLTRLTKDDEADVGYVRPLVKAIRRDLEEEDQELAYFKTMVWEYGANVFQGRTLEMIFEILDKSTTPRSQDLRSLLMELVHQKDMMCRMYYIGKAREQAQEQEHARRQYVGKLRNRSRRSFPPKTIKKRRCHEEVKGVINGLLKLSDDLWKDMVIQCCA